MLQTSSTGPGGKRLANNLDNLNPPLSKKPKILSIEKTNFWSPSADNLSNPAGTTNKVLIFW